MILGKGHNSDSIQPYIKKLPIVLKQRTRKLVIEMAQPRPDGDGKEDVGFWYKYNNLAPYLAPVILEFKKAIPSLESVHLIFWYEYCHVTMHYWQSHLEKLAEDWIAIEGNHQKDATGVCEDKTTDKFNPEVSHVQVEDDWYNPAEMIGFNVYREDLDPDFNASGMLKPKFFLKVQFNLFDFSDPDAGDGGWNDVQLWDSYADRTLKNDSTLQLEFVAKDLKYEEHVQGILEGRQFNPKGWAHEEINLMNERDRDAMLHTRCVSKDTCQPLYIKTVRAV
ncbi:hypothetical protein NW762_005440 [Fusarium torreyae]|uniref:Uncharacterized protein n=1 Tax=Fusarium torreyae TaxID=1237075 RepID=A0A9W8VG52_9HYPO|nr:hypothetical protein NW762_005440 [Fusarium torreyae]